MRPRHPILEHLRFGGQTVGFGKGREGVFEVGEEGVVVGCKVVAFVVVLEVDEEVDALLLTIC